MKKLLFSSIFFVFMMTKTMSEFVYPEIIVKPSRESDYFKSWQVGARVGINPAYYSNRTKTLTVPKNVQENLVQSQVKAPKFSDQFEMPLYIAGELDFNIDPYLTAFVDVNYTYAKGKVTEFVWKNSVYNQEFSAFQAIGAYIGMRYYGLITTDNFVPFVGGKLGLQTRGDVCIKQIIDNDVTNFTQYDFFQSNTALSGGLQVGFDWYINNCFAFTAQTEALFTGPMKNNALFSDLQSSLVVVDNTGAVISIPFSVGFKFSF